MERGKKANNIAIGVFIFSGLFVILLFIYFAGKFSFFLGGGYKLLIEYEFLDNLQPGAKVKVSGGPAIGHVGKINFDTGKIIVETWIQGHYKINRSAVFNIYSTSLVGQKYINVSGYDSSSTDYYTNNEIVMGITPIGFARTIELAGAGVKSLMGPANTDTISKVKDLFNNTSELMLGLNHLINDNAKDIRQSIIKLNTGIQNTGEIMHRINNTLVNIESSSKKLNSTLSSINESDVLSIISNVNVATYELKNLSSDLNRLSYDRNSPLSLARDREFRVRLENTVKNFEEFSKKIKDNPSTLFFGK
jgi:ABC-type transporter Mla subunit MlaD